MRWQNWSGRQKADPDKIAFLRSDEDAVALVKQVAGRSGKMRVAGAGHSHSGIVPGEDIIADVSGLSGVGSVDSGSQRAWCRAGSPIYSLGGQLHAHGLALRNQGDIDRQLIGGAIATGTHGTGRQLQNISASVTALRIVLASGDHVTCSPEENEEIFQVARLGIGSIGLVTDVELQLGESRVLAEKSRVALWDDFIGDVESLIEQHERFEFFWYPGSDEGTLKSIDGTDQQPVYPLGDEGERQAFSYEVLPSYRPHLHTEMEYSIPAESGLECLASIRKLLRERFPDVVWPVEYRTVAADDIWLSMASERETVTISVHQDIREDDHAYFSACEEIFLGYGGRPHWGKVNYLDGDQFARCYPKWNDWWRVRNEYDPGGMFLNAWAAGLNPGD